MSKLLESFRLLLTMDTEILQIIGVTLRMSFFSTTISCLVGMPLGILLSKGNFKGKNSIKRLVNTLMGLPPVVAGLLVYLLFTRYGPFGDLQLLFTVEIMVIAQCVLITPIVISNTHYIVEVKSNQLIETAKGMGLGKFKTFALLFTENRRSLISVVLTAFGRSIAEVGAVSLVGGNIQWKTRVMTTAILLETNKGDFTFALALGIILLFIALIVNILASILSKENER